MPERLLVTGGLVIDPARKLEAVRDVLISDGKIEDVAPSLARKAALKGVPWRKRGARVREALELCGLTDMVRRSIGQLSKGYRQRVGPADTLVADPPVLILDEPTVGLDPRQIVEVRELIKRLAKDKTILLSTHYLPEVEQICDRVVIIHQGRIALDDTLESIHQGPGGKTRSLEEAFIEVTGEDASVVGAQGARGTPPKTPGRVEGSADGAATSHQEG